MDKHDLEYIPKYAECYKRGLMGDDLSAQKAHLLWMCFKRDTQIKLLEMRCKIPNCSDMQFASMLLEFRSSTDHNSNNIYNELETR